MKTLKTIVYNSVESVPNSFWNDLDIDRPLYFESAFLKAFEVSNPKIRFRYLFILNDHRATAITILQFIPISVEAITKNVRMANWLKKIIRKYFSNSHLRVLFCGNVFLSGEYGIYINSSENKSQTFEAIVKGIKLEIKNTKKLHTVFVKDFYQESLSITDILNSFDYAPLQVEPNMIVSMDPQWQSFEDYKNQLKSKYRIKVNKADSKSSELTTKLFDVNDVKLFKKELQSLYENTINNADFNAQVLNLNTYILLKEAYGDQFILKGYFLKNELVGFLSAMLDDSDLVAHFIGLDYSQNKSHAIYPRILNDYIRLGIENNSKTINLGRTALEIKSTIGAMPSNLTCYAKHKRSLPNTMLKPFIKNIKIKPYKQHEPFKTELLSNQI